VTDILLEKDPEKKCQKESELVTQICPIQVEKEDVKAK